MQRIRIQPRSNWQSKVEELGLLYHSPHGKVYWDESAYYQFPLWQITQIEEASEQLFQLYLAAAQHVIDNNRFAEIGIPERAIPWIKRQWEEEPPSLYGRFDLAYDGILPPKLLEFNADTPTSLLEASVVQWYWLQDVHNGLDQFNSLHEKLIAKWKDLKPYLQGDVLHFCHMDNWEDWMTVSYLRDTAHEAGLNTGALLMEELGYSSVDGTFRDTTDNQISSIFKLYPWEWLIDEIPKGTDETFFRMQWIEPVWKLLWSNKAMLAILWELNPGSPFLLPCYLDGPRKLTRYVRKPFFSREGANVSITDPNGAVSTDGPYANGPWVYQQLAQVPQQQGNYAVLGSWYVMDQGPAGMGVRESTNIITDNFSRFVPHVIKD
ncbi:MAG: glutathionylspermidine synthase family protein [Oligoflexia bacterium]|nr:glutathionylspermidine synthase family protein [Oligoflexia bacterium]